MCSRFQGMDSQELKPAWFQRAASIHVTGFLQKQWQFQAVLCWFSEESQTIVCLTTGSRSPCDLCQECFLQGKLLSPGEITAQKGIFHFLFSFFSFHIFFCLNENQSESKLIRGVSDWYQECFRCLKNRKAPLILSTVATVLERNLKDIKIYVSWIAVKSLLTTKDREFQCTLSLHKMQSLVSLQKCLLTHHLLVLSCTLLPNLH